jgi:hypothetical protein
MLGLYAAVHWRRAVALYMALFTSEWIQNKYVP